MNIPDDLMKTAMSLSKHGTKTQTLIVALQEFIRKKKVEKIMAHQGKLEFDDTWKESRHVR